MKGSVRKRGSKWSYSFRYQDEFGKWKTKEKGGWESESIARSECEKAITEYQNSNFVQKVVSYTLSEYIDYYFENVGDFKLSYYTLINYKSMAKVHVKPVIGHLKLDKITVDILQRFFTKLSNEQNRSTINRVKIVIDNSLNLAKKQGLIKYNPLRDVEIVRKQDRQKFYQLDREKVDYILENVYEVYYLPFLIAVHLGTRRGETLALRFSDIDFENNTVTINKQLQVHGTEVKIVRPKTKSSNGVLVMSNVLREELLKAQKQQAINKEKYGDKYYSDMDLICCSKYGKPILPNTLTQYTKRYSREIGIYFSYHHLRHAHGSLLLESGASVKIIQQRLRHSDIQTTLNIYTHSTIELEHKSMDGFNQLFK